MALDTIDWQILEALQENARVSFTELARRVGLSPPAAAERVRRLESSGVVRGYRADVDPGKAGRPIMALIRMATPPGSPCAALMTALRDVPEVLEAYRMTGPDTALVKVAVSSTEHLEKLLDRLGRVGRSTTGIATSSFQRIPAITRPGPARSRKRRPVR